MKGLSFLSSLPVIYLPSWLMFNVSLSLSVSVMIIMTDKEDNDKDTMNISQDGKYITGKLDKKDRPFKLTRTK